MIVFALALVAAQSASDADAGLAPATAAAIIAGGKACLGATVDGAGEDARLAGWSDATPRQKAGVKTDGRVVIRDDVMLMVKTGIDGGCVVRARTATDFDRAAFLSGLGAAMGTTVVADKQKPVTNLPNGELPVTMLDDRSAMLVVANPKGKYAAKPHDQSNQGIKP